MTSSKRPRRAGLTRLPRIGPCRDPLCLWFLEFATGDGRRWRKYFSNRDEARRALKSFRAGVK